ncbi:MAG: hypothetical protein FWF22_04155, partial [Treponema sp.]|nr:hypothetical protein [Treponema sp.]
DIPVYTNGGITVSINTTMSPYYEMEFSVDNDIQTGWPTTEIWSSYGLTVSSTAPGYTVNISYTNEPPDDTTTDNELTVTFTGSSTGSSASNNLTSLETTIKGYFSSWIAGDAITTAYPYTYTYTKGKYEATFTISSKTTSGNGNTATATASYNIDIAPRGVWTPGWPDNNSKATYGITGNWPTSLVANSNGYTLTDDGSLVIWYNVSTSNVKTPDTTSQGIFSGWSLDSTNTSTNPLEYSKGLFNATLAVTGSSSGSYYEMEIAKNTDMVTGWPTDTTTLTRFFVNGGTKPTTGITDVYYFVDDNGTTSTTDDTLTIIFMASNVANARAAVQTWLAANTWSTDSTSVTSGLVEYYSDATGGTNLSADLNSDTTSVSLTIYLN